MAIRSYRNTAVVIDVTTDGAGYLVLNDPYHPWWVAEIDGHETPILQANVLFRAVEVPTGSHRIRFVFRPVLGAWRRGAPPLARSRRAVP